MAEISTSINPIRVQRKITNPRVVTIINKLAYEWGLTPAEACYRLINEAAIKEHEKIINGKSN